MTIEQEKAIEILEHIKKEFKGNAKAPNINSRNTATIKIQAIETVLNMLKEKDKELDIKEEQIEYIKNEYGKTIEEQGKQIDLMAEFIFQNIDVEEDICNSAYVECTQETAQDITCINCIKQYFERKSEE